MLLHSTAGKSSPEWAAESIKGGKSLRYNEEFRRRVELIQDFQFPEASQRIKMSADGQFIGAVGTYKPQFRCFSVHDLSLKFERHIVSFMGSRRRCLCGVSYFDRRMANSAAPPVAFRSNAAFKFRAILFRSHAE